MPAEQRSLSEILQDTIRNIQQIVRSEVHLAKSEVREEFAKAKASALLFAIGTLTASFAVLMLLFAAVYALALFIPVWTAAVIMGCLLAVVAALMVSAGRSRFKQIRPTPKRTLETIKENVEWAKQQAK